jgi:lipooligosaccharide transport system permease protein
MRYIAFLAAGTVCYSSMNSATFEALYSAFSRMHVQRTWEAIMHAPLDLDDIVLAEALWAASKSTLSGTAIVVVIWALGLSASPYLPWIPPLAFLMGLTFAAMALVMNAVSPGYDFFLYYFTLVVTPMTLLCGVFFPVEQLPALLQSISRSLPLYHAIALVRPLVRGDVPATLVLHVAVIAAYGVVAFYVALALTRRRLLV